MQVREVMTPNPASCRSDDKILDVAKRMTTEDVGSIPIVDDEDRLIGIVTDRDIVMRVVAEGRDPQTTTAGEVATGNPVTVTPDENLDHALAKLATEQVRRLPVIEEDRLVGIIAQADVAREMDNETTGDIVEEISE